MLRLGLGNYVGSRSLGKVPPIPTIGTLVVVSDTEITVPYTSSYPVEIWYSTTELGTYTKHGDSASTPYAMTGLTQGTLYWIKVRSKNGSKYSAFGSAASACTTYIMLLTSTSNGTGVSTLICESSSNVVVTLGVNAKFYTDSGGTANESDTWTITTGGARTIYIKCTTGTATMSFNDITKLTKISSWASSTNAASLGGDISKMVNATVLQITGFNSVSGSVANLIYLTLLRIADVTTISGSIQNLVNLIYLRVVGSQNTLTYGTKTWASNMSYFQVQPKVANPWTISDISLAIKEVGNTTWDNTTRVFSMASNQPVMADTNQGGIWGSFDSGYYPSDLAVNYKKLIKDKLVTVTLNGITAPSTTGDGTGFPAGFGDWYRLWQDYFSIPNDTINLVVGNETTIYGNSLINTPLSSTLTVAYTCDIGTESTDDYVISPLEADIGSHNLIITFSESGTVFLVKTITIIVNALSDEGSLKLLMIGDSTLLGDIEVIGAEIDSILTNNTISYIGTQGTTRKHEGYSGYTFKNFVDGIANPSPFVFDSVLNIPKYFTDNEIDTPDLIHIRLGINDIFVYTFGTDANHTTILGYSETLINAFLNYNSNIKILISVPTICSVSTIKWAADYSAYSQDDYMNAMHRFWLALTNKYKNNVFSSRVDISYEAINLNRDTGYDNAIHLTEGGNQEIGGALSGYINKYLI